MVDLKIADRVAWLVDVVAPFSFVILALFLEGAVNSIDFGIDNSSKIKKKEKIQ